MNFESFFDQNDTALAIILKKVIGEESLANLNGNENNLLIRSIAYQILRSKIQRTSFVSMHEQLKKQIEDEGFISNIQVPTEQQAKVYSLEKLLNAEKLIDSLSNKILLLYKTQRQKFWISDNPVIIFNSLPYGEMSIDSRGVQAFFPISDRLMLCLLCPSHLEDISRRHQRLISTDIINPSTLNETSRFETQTIEDRGVSFLKYLQIASSSRFLYSSDSNFSFATEILKEFPQYKEIKSKASVGEIGKGPPPKKNMHKGEYLVVYGNKYNHMVKIKVLKGHITATFITNDSDSMKEIVDDEPIQRAEIYLDGKINKQIPRPRFERTIENGEVIYELGYLDKSIEQLLKNVLKE